MNRLTPDHMMHTGSSNDKLGDLKHPINCIHRHNKGCKFFTTFIQRGHKGGTTNEAGMCICPSVNIGATITPGKFYPCTTEDYCPPDCCQRTADGIFNSLNPQANEERNATDKLGELIAFCDHEIAECFSQLNRSDLNHIAKERLRGEISAYDRVKGQVILKRTKAHKGIEKADIKFSKGLNKPLPPFTGEVVDDGPSV